jgi:hypothetical protein
MSTNLLSTVLSWSSTPTLAERQREELSKRLTSFGIKLSDSDNSSSSPLLEKEEKINLDKTEKSKCKF